jgi:hypothetical protein
MTYKGRRLLGEVREVIPGRGYAYPRLSVRHFNGEMWPLEPIEWEVFPLERTYDPPDECHVYYDRRRGAFGQWEPLYCTLAPGHDGPHGRD